jgi:hypothetical protein
LVQQVVEEASDQTYTQDCTDKNSSCKAVPSCHQQAGSFVLLLLLLLLRLRLWLSLHSVRTVQQQPKQSAYSCLQAPMNMLALSQMFSSTFLQHAMNTWLTCCRCHCCFCYGGRGWPRQDRVAAAKAERNAATATAGFTALLRQRYFAGAGGGKGGKAGKAGPYEGLQPGAITAELAEALGERLACLLGEVPMR